MNKLVLSAVSWLGIITTVFPFAAWAQTTVREPSREESLVALSALSSRMDDAESREDEKECVPGNGNFTVSGTVFEFGPDQSIKPAEKIRVTLTQAGRSAIRHETDPNGKYCIVFPGGPQILLLSFQSRDKGKSCIRWLSGSASHIINKVVENSCVDPLSLDATPLPSALTSKIIPKSMAQQYEILNAGVTLSADYDFLLLNAALDRQNGCPADSIDSLQSIKQEVPGSRVPAVDPELVALTLDGQRNQGFALFRFGPFSLLSVKHDADFRAYDFIFQRAFRPNQILPRSSITHLVMFFPQRAAVGQDLTKPSSPSTKDMQTTPSSLFLFGRPIPNTQSESISDFVSTCQNVRLSTN
jgi:hypothetical protein